MDFIEAIEVLNEVQNHNGNLSHSQRNKMKDISLLLTQLHQENVQLKKEAEIKNSSYAAVASRNPETQSPPKAEKTIIFKTQTGDNNNVLNVVYKSIETIRKNHAVKISKVIKTKTGAIVKTPVEENIDI